MQWSARRLTWLQVALSASSASLCNFSAQLYLKAGSTFAKGIYVVLEAEYDHLLMNE